jgi:hypothetical protein
MTNQTRFTRRAKGGSAVLVAGGTAEAMLSSRTAGAGVDMVPGKGDGVSWGARKSDCVVRGGARCARVMKRG